MLEPISGEAMISLASGVIGALVGAIATWVVTTKATRNQARRDSLVKAARALQDYGVAYAQWYTEYLSPQAQSQGLWTKPPTGKPDPVYLNMMNAVDRGRGELRVIQGLLYALFPQDVIKPIYAEIMKVLVMSGPPQADCREVNRVLEGACDLMPDLMRKYS